METLLNALKEYDSTGISGSCGDFFVGRGGYDMEFFIDFQNRQIASCVDGELQNDGIEPFLFDVVYSVVHSVFNDVRKCEYEEED